MRCRLVLILLLSAIVPVQAGDPYLPAELEPWKQWVLDGHEEIACPTRSGKSGGERVCQWPGTLKLDLATKGGKFTLDWWSAAPGWVALPGDLQHWPLAVKVDGLAAVLVWRQSAPMLHVAKGNHHILGEFRWQQTPQRLAIPAALGLLRLRMDGKDVVLPRYNKAQLWLGNDHARQAQKPQLSLRVHRLLRDGIPQTLETTISLRVSGPAREVALGRALPAGFVPMALDAPLPVRLDHKQTLWAQVRTGSWQITLKARSLSRKDAAGPEPGAAPWPGEEIWSYASADQQRLTEVHGPSPVDPAQSAVPDQWHRFPAFRLRPEESLRITELSRGINPAAANRLNLQRNAWLRFDGDSWLAEDRIQGELVRDWRLDMAAPYQLQRMDSNGKPLLLTRVKETAVGAELRNTRPNLRAVAVLPRSYGKQPVSGWNSSFQRVTTTLHLPPGYRLLSAGGFDAVSGDWLSRWNLLNVFMVVISAVALWRVLGAASGVLALITLLLIVHEPGAPAWSWLGVTLAVLLLAVVPGGWMRRSVRSYAVLSGLVLLITVVPFAFQQARLAIYPQLAQLYAPYPAASPAPSRAKAPEEAVRGIADMAQTPPAKKLPAALSMRERKVRLHLTPYAPGALIQAGIATPSWRWDRAELVNKGGVSADQSMRLIIAPPWFTALWRLLGAVLSLGLALWLLRHIARRWSAAEAPASPALTAWLVLLLAGVSTAFAATPSDSLLKELQQRLLRGPECLPHCTQITTVHVTARAERLDLRLSVNALDRTVVALPGRRDTWLTDTLSVDGQRQSWLRQQKQQLLLPLPRTGTYVVHLSGPLPASDRFNLVFPQRPVTVIFSGTDWQASGLKEGKLSGNTLSLMRRAKPNPKARSQQTEHLRMPVFVSVSRHLLLDSTWSVTTRVQRLAPASAAFSVTVPRLPTGQVLTGGSAIKVAEGSLTLDFAAGQSQFSYRTRLPQQSPLTLTAASQETLRENWRFSASPMWHLKFTGPAPSTHGAGTSTQFQPLFLPLPGETLTLDISRPESAPGATLAIQHVDVFQDIGAARHSMTLGYVYESTRGGRQTITLPADINLQSVQLDGKTVGVPMTDGHIPIAVSPGVHRVDLRWDRTANGRFSVFGPKVDLGAPSSNISLNLHLPKQRWILFASGPLLGPAVTYWSELALLLALALAIGRFGPGPIRRWQWLLLGFGLSLTAWPELLALAAWIGLLNWRGQHAAGWSRQRFHLTQVLLMLFTVVVIGGLLSAIGHGLLSDPDMGIIGNGSSGHKLNWFADVSAAVLPRPRVISLPLWSYKLVILLWSIWLSLALVDWLRWAWEHFSRQGVWRSRVDAA